MGSITAMIPRLCSGMTMVGLAVAAAAQTPPRLAITHVSVVDVANGTLLAEQTVTIAEDRIQSVASAATPVPDGARIVDGRGKYLIPALWDMHVHLSYARSSAFPALVANGVAYVRDVGSQLAEIDEWRGEIAAGHLVGPLIVRAGPILNGAASNRYRIPIPTAADARATVRALHNVGVDLIKTHRNTPREAYFAMAEEARRLSLPFVGHIPRTVTPAEASNAGQQTIEHAVTLFEGTFSADLPDEAAWAPAIARWRQTPAAQDLFATFVKNGTVVDATLITLRRLNAWLENPVDPRDKYIAASAWREARPLLDPLRPDAAKLLAARGPLEREAEAVVGQMHRAGVRIVTGTDISFTLLHPGFSLQDELRALVDAGLSPAEALRAGSLNCAQLFPKIGAGEIAAGKRADVLLLDGNPLQDIGNAARIRALVLAGRLFDRAALDKLLADAVAQSTVQ